MRYISSIKEFRTIGFRYSEPDIKVNALMYCTGELSKDDLIALLDDINVKFEKLNITEEQKEVEIEDFTIQTNIMVELDFFVFDEKEISTISQEIRTGLNREFDVQVIEFLCKLAPRLKLNKFNESIVKVNGGNSYKSYRIQNLPHRGEPIEKDISKISIFQQDWFEKLLPDTFTIVSSPNLKRLNFDQSLNKIEPKHLTFEKNDCTIDSDLVQFNYWYENPDNPLDDAEPSCLEFDIHFVKNNNGIKLLIDITYGDNMASEFSIESPNKVNVIHYTGIGSKYDPSTHWGFSDKSIKDLVKFFNSFTHGINLTTKDLSFLDEHIDSYKHKIDNKDHLYTDESDLLTFGNSAKNQ